jgi:hypothetical protein
VHERFVDAVERLREAIRFLAQLVCERDELLEVDFAVREFRAELPDDLVEMLRQLLGVL